MIDFDVVVIGGGPAGMAAALAAHKKGASTLLLERNVKLGGILNQCIHAGFGLHYFGEEMTGPEYAGRFRKEVLSTDINVKYEAMVLSVEAHESERRVTYVSPEHGTETVSAGAVVLAMGCRERTAGAIALAGTRPAGIYTAGMAQKLCNEEGYLVGKKVVVLGSGDIGLIMARRMTLEGAEVKAVIELMPYSSGLKRNIVQCLNDFDIPIYYAHTVTRVEGNPRLTAVYFAPVDENRKADLQKEACIECDTLLLSVGLIPENDLLNGTDIKMDRITGGAVVDENRMTSVRGIFAAGNTLHVHDLVDNVSVEAETAGVSAADFAAGKLIKAGKYYGVSAKNGVRYALPQNITAGSTVVGEGVKIFFRTDNVYKSAKLIVESGGETAFTKKYAVLAPGEMESVTLSRDVIKGDVLLRLEQ